MISPISSSAVASEVSAQAQAAAPIATQPATLKPDSVSISPKGHAAAAGDVDGDGDSH